MKKYYFRIAVTISSLFVGLFCVFAFNIYQEVKRSLNNPQALINPDMGKPKVIEIPFVVDGKFMDVEIDENEPFTFLAHGCGNGYVDSFITSEGERLSSGLEPIKPKQFNYEISKAEIIQKIENYKNNDGVKGTRLILKGKNTKSDKDYFEIDWYDGKNNLFIVAPSLELALKFEEWNKLHK